MKWKLILLVTGMLSLQLLAIQDIDPAKEVLPGTGKLEKIEDPAAEMVGGIHRFLDRQLAE